MKSLARFAARRPWLVLASWIVIAIGLQVASTASGPDMRDTFSLPGTDSQAAYDLLDERFPAAAGDADTIAFQVSDGAITDADASAAIAALLTEVSEVPAVA